MILFTHASRRSPTDASWWKSSWWVVAMAAIANFVAGYLTVLVPVEGGPNHIVTVMWPPMGITFVLAWFFGWRAILGSTMGIFLFLSQVHGHLPFSLFGTMTTILPTTYATWRLRRNGIDDLFASPRNIAQFVLFAVVIAPLLSAVLGFCAPLLLGLSEIQWDALAAFALWVNGASANSIIAPALLRIGDWRGTSRRRLLELSGVVAAMCILWGGMFFWRAQPLVLPIMMMTTPFLILMAFRFNFGVVAGFSLTVSALVLMSLTQRPYPLYQNEFFLTCAYLGMLGLSNLAVGAGSAAMRATVARLVRSEESLRGVFNQAAVGIVLFDIERDSPMFNPKFGEMIGYETNEINKEKLRSLAFPEEQEITDQLAMKMQRGEISSFRQEKRYVRKDGSIIWASLTMSLLRDKLGHDKLLIGIYEDITQRKLAEKQIEGQTRILHNLTDDHALPDLLNELAQFAEDLWPASRSAIFLADHKAENLHLVAAPSWPKTIARPSAAIAINSGTSPTLSAAAQKSTVISQQLSATAEHAALNPLMHAEPQRTTCWAIPFLDKNGKLFGVLSFYFDHACAPTAHDNELITMIGSLASLVMQHYRDEEKLRDSEQRFRITFEQAAVGVALLDRDANWLQVNEKFCEIAGYSHDELMRLPYQKLIAPEDLEFTLQTVSGVVNHNASQVQLDHRYMRKSGDVIWVNSQFSVTRNASGEVDYQIAIIKDITERKLAETEIERLALYDYLTELPNRRLFGDRLRTAVMAAKRSERFGALIYIDLDNFKQLNDTHGHNAGDDFLKMVAHRLQRNLREEDTVARLGGDEFVVLLQNVSDSLEAATTATAAIAVKIQSALSEPFLLPNGIEHIVTSSLGITLFPKDADNADDLLREADIAMYRVKESQRNAMRFYEPEMKAEVDSRLALERALRRALQDDEFELYLQPQYDGHHNMVSCEALLRWPQPDGGFISPNEFIPIAEETGLIVPLGEWVLRRAGQLVCALELAGYQLSLCVNVSPRQFSEANFVERVRTILWETGADAGRIVLEITEGVVVGDFDDVRKKMHALRQMGIILSIDDFGTGHSSLAYLKLLPLHELKIDRAFVHSLPDDDNDVAIVEAVLSVARHLQLEVVAEGVETPEQFEFLRQRGCHRFQGYLLAKPAAPQQHFPELATLPLPANNATE